MQQNQTQMLLLELLRQNNMSSMTQQNPNSSMYGSAFLGAQQLLAQ
jgi:hypothetical protein